MDKPWFDNNCGVKLKAYHKALYSFNKNKNHINYTNLMNAKSAYKKYMRKCKREYDRYEGNNINFMRKHNPKQFYKLFTKRKSKGSNSNITMMQFMEHFKALNEVHGQPYDDDLGNDSYLQAAYSELDTPIELSEIKNAIKKLNYNKSNAEDCIINEVFIHGREILSPVLCKLFNRIFNSGIYPEAWAKGCVVPIFKREVWKTPIILEG